MNPFLDFDHHFSMNDPSGFLKVVDDECGISIPEVILTSPEVDSKPAAVGEKDRTSENIEAPTLDAGISKSYQISINQKRSSTQVSDFASFTQQGAILPRRNPTIRELQEASNAQKRRRRSGHPDRWNAHLDQLRQFKNEVSTYIALVS